MAPLSVVRQSQSWWAKCTAFMSACCKCLQEIYSFWLLSQMLRVFQFCGILPSFFVLFFIYLVCKGEIFSWFIKNIWICPCVPCSLIVASCGHRQSHLCNFHSFIFFIIGLNSQTTFFLLFFSEPGSTELSGLFLEKPPSSVVAIAGQTHPQMDEKLMRQTENCGNSLPVAYRISICHCCLSKYQDRTWLS